MRPSDGVDVGGMLPGGGTSRDSSAWSCGGGAESGGGGAGVRDVWQWVVERSAWGAAGEQRGSSVLPFRGRGHGLDRNEAGGEWLGVGPSWAAAAEGGRWENREDGAFERRERRGGWLLAVLSGRLSSPCIGIMHGGPT